MNKKRSWMFFVILSALSVHAGNVDSPRTIQNFNDGWQFQLADSLDEAPPSTWRPVTLPHDWSVEASFDSTKEGCTGYLPGGVGWYQKTFVIPESAKDKIHYLIFDGVYNRSDVWINGEHLGFHPYGYSPFYYDLTTHLKPSGQENVVTVRVDHRRYADSRWYTGSGIYRDVKLVSVNPVHVPVWGTFITTPAVSGKEAKVEIEIMLCSHFTSHHHIEVQTTIQNQAATPAASEKQQVTLQAETDDKITQTLKIKNPQLWDIDTPYMYRAVTQIFEDDQLIDEVTTPFGVRTFRFDADEGFFLNGRNMKIKGVCLHHDAGLAGTAVPDDVWKRRLQILKEGGCNAIRCAHNPPSENFLTLCDEMGFLVQNEFFDEMDNPKDKRLNMHERHNDFITRGYDQFFQEWAEKDLKNTMLRDRNHPSIIQWSIGNEIEWTYPHYKHATGYFDAQWSGNYFWTPPHISPDEVKKRYEEMEKGEYILAETAQKLSRWTKSLDTTRPVTANCILPSASHVTGYADALDVVGYSYRRVVYDYGHRYFPEKVIMGTENLGQWHEWKAVLERPFISGLFLWTGIDYMGEARHGWPEKGTASGLLDLAGFKKPSWHLFRCLWNETPHVYIATQVQARSPFRLSESGRVVEKEPGAWQRRLWTWHDVNEHWNYSETDTVIVEVYSNCEQVELFLNDASLGVKSLADFEDHIYKWAVPFQKGELAARGCGKKNRAEASLMTSGKAAGIQISADRSCLTANQTDAVHITVQLVDEAGHAVTTEEKEIEFHLDGKCRLLGVDNGASDNVQDFQSSSVVTHQGRCLMIVQALDEPGTISIQAVSQELKSNRLEIIMEN